MQHYGKSIGKNPWKAARNWSMSPECMKECGGAIQAFGRRSSLPTKENIYNHGMAYCRKGKRLSHIALYWMARAFELKIAIITKDHLWMSSAVPPENLDICFILVGLRDYQAVFGVKFLRFKTALEGTQPEVITIEDDEEQFLDLTQDDDFYDKEPYDDSVFINIMPEEETETPEPGTSKASTSTAWMKTIAEEEGPASPVVKKGPAGAPPGLPPPPQIPRVTQVQLTKALEVIATKPDTGPGQTQPEETAAPTPSPADPSPLQELEAAFRDSLPPAPSADQMAMPTTFQNAVAKITELNLIIRSNVLKISRVEKNLTIANEENLTLDQRVAALRDNVQDAEEDNEAYKTTVEVLQEDKKALKDKIKKLENDKKKLEEEMNIAAAKVAETTQPSKAENAAINAARQAIEDLKKEQQLRSEAQNEATKAKDNLAAAETRHKEELEKAANDTKDELDKIRADNNILRDEKMALNNQLTEVREERQNLTEEQHTLNSEIATAENALKRERSRKRRAANPVRLDPRQSQTAGRGNRS